MNWDMEGVCRICLRIADPKLPIFTEPENNRRQTIATKIMNFAQVQVVKGDGLPTNLCVECYYRINIFLELRETCQKSHHILLEKLDGMRSSTGDLVPDIASAEEIRKRGSLQRSTRSFSDSFSSMSEDKVKVEIPEEPIKAKKDKDVGEKLKTDSSPSDSMEYFCGSSAFQFVKLCNESQTEFQNLKHPSFRIPEKQRDLSIDNAQALCLLYFDLNFKQILLETEQTVYKCVTCEKYCNDVAHCFSHVHCALANTSKANVNRNLKNEVGKNTLKDVTKSKIEISSFLAEKDPKSVIKGGAMRCNFCQFVSASTVGMKNHMYRKHDSEISFQCNICKNKQFASRHEYLNHFRQVHKKNRPRHISLIARHKQLKPFKDSVNSLMYQCNKCLGKYTSLYNCRRHIQQNHQIYMGYDCFITKIVGNSKSSKPIRMNAADHPPVIRTTPVMDNNFILIQNAEGETRFQCKGCKFTYEGSFNAKRHFYRIMHKEDALNDEFVCYCKMRFKSRSQLMLHKFNKHKIAAKNTVKLNRTRQKKKSISQPQTLAEVSKGESEDLNGVSAEPLTYRCDKCNKIFRAKSNYESHIDKCNLGLSLPCKCPFCKKTFENNKLLQRHTKRFHNALRFQCRQCSSAFSTQFKLNQHRLLVHKTVNKEVNNPKLETLLSKKTVENKKSDELLKGRSLGGNESITPQKESSETQNEIVTSSEAVLKKCPEVSKEHEISSEKKLESPTELNTVSSVISSEESISSSIESKLVSEAFLENQKAFKKMFRCDICEEEVGALQILQIHVENQHAGHDLNFKCPECSLTFPKPQSCYMHMQRVHKPGLTYDIVFVPRSGPLNINNERPLENNEIEMEHECIELSDEDDLKDDKKGSIRIGEREDKDDDNGLESKEWNNSTEIALESSRKKPGYYCGLCDSTFLQEESLITHLSSQLHKEMRFIKLNKNKRYLKSEPISNRGSD